MRTEYDPLGNDVPLFDPAPPDDATPDYVYVGDYGQGGNIYDAAGGCTVDGQPMSCSFLLRLRATGKGLTSAVTTSVTQGSYVWVDEWVDDVEAPGAEDVFNFNVAPGENVKYRGHAGTTIARNVGGYRFIQTGTVQQRPAPVQPQNPVPLPDVPSGIAARLKKKDCAPFVKKLLRKVSTPANPVRSTDLTDILKYVTIDFSDQGMTRRGHHAAGRAHPRDASGKGRIGVSPVGGPGAVESGIQAEYLSTILHELIHQAGANRRYTDSELANAAYAVGQGKIPKYQREWYAERYNTLDPNNADQNSEFFDDILRLHCPP